MLVQPNLASTRLGNSPVLFQSPWTVSPHRVSPTVGHYIAAPPGTACRERLVTHSMHYKSLGQRATTKQNAMPTSWILQTPILDVNNVSHDAMRKLCQATGKASRCFLESTPNTEFPQLNINSDRYTASG
jgi:hypothetical protein